MSESPMPDSGPLSVEQAVAALAPETAPEAPIPAAEEPENPEGETITPEEAPAQLLIQVVKIWPQALLSESQQLCPPLTFTTTREAEGCDKFTTVFFEGIEYRGCNKLQVNFECRMC